MWATTQVVVGDCMVGLRTFLWEIYSENNLWQAMSSSDSCFWLVLEHSI